MVVVSVAIVFASNEASIDVDTTKVVDRVLVVFVGTVNVLSAVTIVVIEGMLVV
jgi:hypothetical protein